INVGAALINLAALAVLLTVVARYGSRSLVLWVPAALGLYMLRLAPVLVSAWNPHVIVMPLAALVAMSAALTAGHLSLAPLAVGLGSFCAQTHVGVGPAVGALWAFAFATIALLAYRGEIPNGRAARRWLNVAMW